jgi:hypothetical protein
LITSKDNQGPYLDAIIGAVIHLTNKIHINEIVHVRKPKREKYWDLSLDKA